MVNQYHVKDILSAGQKMLDIVYIWIVFSEICYGGYSVGIKCFFNRGISDCSPFLTYRKEKTYHINPYKIKQKLVVYFYRYCSEYERETSKEYVKFQAVNMDADTH